MTTWTLQPSKICDEVEGAAAGLKRDQQAEIAAGVRLSAGRRAEDADVPCAAVEPRTIGGVKV